MINRRLLTATLALCIGASVTLLGACGDADSAGVVGPPGGVGIAQPGARDFGQFRQILEQREIPAPNILDPIGFFAEHKLDYPSPTCGQNVCAHALVGAMANMINGGDCTIIQLGLNSPIDLEQMPRPPLHLVVAVDTSGSMAGSPITYLRDGLAKMVNQLKPEDTVTLIRYSNEASIVLEAAPALDKAPLLAAVAGLQVGGSTNLYDGLFRAFSVAAQHRQANVETRVIFLSDGVATAGIQDKQAMVDLAQSWAREGIPLSTIGVGKDFDVETMRRLGEVGAGNFYFLEDPKAIKEVFVDELATFLIPVALDVQIEVSVAPGYALSAAYGSNSWTVDTDGGRIDLPALFLARRTSAKDPINNGRRGGGGAIIIELVASSAAGSIGIDVGQIALSYTDPVSGQRMSQQISLDAPHPPTAIPPSGYFSSTTVEKGFVMLNILAGFQIATELTAIADPRSAQATLRALRDNVIDWLERNNDPDILDDLRYINMFIENLEVEVAKTPIYEPEPPNPWPQD